MDPAQSKPQAARRGGGWIGLWVAALALADGNINLAAPPPRPPARPVADQSPAAPPIARPAQAPARAGGEFRRPTTVAWTVSPDPGPPRWKPAEAAASTLPFSPDAYLVLPGRQSPFIANYVSRSQEGQFIVRDLHTGEDAGTLTVARNEIKLPLLSEDGQYISGQVGIDSAIAVYSTRTGQRAHLLDTGRNSKAIASPGSDRLVTYTEGFQRGTLVLWDLKNGHRLGEINAPSKMERHLTSLSPGGRFLANLDHHLLWDLEKGILAGELIASSTAVGPPMAVAFSPDGTELAAVYHPSQFQTDRLAPPGRQLLVWSMKNGKKVLDRTLDNVKREPQSRLSRVAEDRLEWSPDGQRLLFGQILIDRPSAQIIFEIPQSKPGQLDRARLFLDDNRLLIAGPGTGPASPLTPYPLPEEQFAERTALVRANGKVVDLLLPPLTPTDFTRAAKVELSTPAANAWPLVDPTPGAATRPKEGAFLLKPYATQAELKGRSVIASLPVHLSGPGACQAIAVHALSSGRGDPSRAGVRVDRIDLAHGGSNSALELPVGSEVLSYSFDGRMIAASHERDRIDIHAFADQGAKHIVGFRPYHGASDRKILSATIISPERLLTEGAAGHMVLWSLPDARPIYSLKVSASRSGSLFLSPGGKYMALRKEAHLHIVEVATGKTLARIAEAGWVVRFDATGTRLAASRTTLSTSGKSTDVNVWDLREGKHLYQITVPFIDRASELHWVSSRYLLVGGEFLVDVEREIAVWRYTTLASDIRRGPGIDGRFWYTARTGEPELGQAQGMMLTSVELPHAAALKEMTPAKLDEMVAVWPGSKVSIEVRIIGTAEERKEVTEAMTQRLAEGGFTVAEGQPVRLVATTAVKNTRAVEFEEWAPQRRVVSVAIKDHEAKVALVVHGSEVWQTSSIKRGDDGSMSLGITRLKEGETAQSHFDAINKANNGFLTSASVQLPRRAVKTNAVNGLGQTDLTRPDFLGVPIKLALPAERTLTRLPPAAPPAGAVGPRLPGPAVVPTDLLDRGDDRPDPNPIARPDPSKATTWSATPDPGPERWKAPANLTSTIRHSGTATLVFPDRDSPFVALRTTTAAYEDLLTIRDLRTGRDATVKTPREIQKPLLSADGQYIAGATLPTSDAPNSVIVYAVKTGQRAQVLDVGPDCRVIAFAGSDRLLTLAPASAEGKFVLWDLATGKRVHELDTKNLMLFELPCISPGGKYLASLTRQSMSNDNRKVTVWSLETGKVAGSQAVARSRTDEEPTAMAFSPDGAELALVLSSRSSMDNSGHIVIWSMSDGGRLLDKQVPALKRNASTHKEDGLKWSPDGQRLLYGESLIDRVSGHVVHEIPQSLPTRVDLVRRFLDANRLMVIGPTTGELFPLMTYPLPQADIAKVATALRAGGRKIDASLPPLTAIDLSAARLVELPRRVESAWPMVDPAPASLKKPRSGGFRLNVLDPSARLQPRPRAIYFSSPAACQAIAVQDRPVPPKPGATARPAAGVRVERIDLAAGNTTGALDLPAGSEVVAFSPDGKLIATSFQGDRIDVHAFGGPEGKHIVGFRPYPGLTRRRFGPDDRSDVAVIESCAIVGGDRLLTVSNTGMLVLWSLPDAKPIYTIKDRIHNLTVSPGGKYLAVSRGEEVVLVDLASGETKAAISAPRAVSMAFHPDGRRLAIARPFGLDVWDLQTGELLHQVFLSSELRRNSPVDWLAGPYLMLGDEFLVDLDSKMVVWRYAPLLTASRRNPSPDGRYWHVTPAGGQENRLTLVAIDLPHAAARKEIPAMKVEELLEIKPGERVSLELNVPGSAGDYKKVLTETLTQRLRDMGFAVGQGEKAQLVVTTTEKSSRSEKYEDVAVQTHSLTVRAYDHKLALTVLNREIWSATATTGGIAPDSFTLRAEQSPQDVMNEINRQETEFFQTVRIPQLLFKAEAANGAGQSRLTVRGAEPLNPGERWPER